MSYDDNTIITRTGNKFDIEIIDFDIEVLKTRLEIRKLKDKHSKVSLNFLKARKTFLDQFSRPIFNENIAENTEASFEAMKKFINSKEQLYGQVNWEIAYLECYDEDINITYIKSRNCTATEIKQLVKIFRKKLVTWLQLNEQTWIEDVFIYTCAGFDLHIVPQEEKELEGITHYIGTFTNVDNGKTLVLKAVE